jgi:hypothetical protein
MLVVLSWRHFYLTVSVQLTGVLYDIVLVRYSFCFIYFFYIKLWCDINTMVYGNKIEIFVS